MNASVYRFSLDVHEAHANVCLDVKRGDTKSRLLLITLSEDGVPYHISPECYAVFTAEKPDGNKVFNPCTIKGDQISYVLTPQTVAVDGKLDCEIKLYGADDTLITSPGFDIIVRPTVYNEGDVIESDHEILALTHLISEATTVITEGKEVIDEIEDLVAEDKEVSEEIKNLVADMEAKREELAQNIADTKTYSDTAKSNAEKAEFAKQDAVAYADSASASASSASASATAAKASQQSAATSEANANQSMNSAATSASAARASQQEAKNSETASANYATEAKNASYTASAFKSAAQDAETSAANYAQEAKKSKEAAKSSETASANHEAEAKMYSEGSAASASAAKASEEAAKASEEAAKRHADTIDTEQINAKIATKADDLFFDDETSLLYLVSDGKVIGNGVKVATTGGGGGGGNMSYTITLENLLESRLFTVSEGTKVELKFTYASVDEEGYDDGPGIGKIIVNDATRETFTAEQGENIRDVTPFLSAGSNTVKVQVENSENARKTLPYTITVAAAYITSAFDVSAPFTGEIPFIYTPTGLADKTIHFELDGTEIGTALVTVSGRQQTYTIPAQSHGSHILRVWFDCEIEGTPVTSNVISFALICTEEGNTDPVIAVNPNPLTDVEQYTNIVTKYRVYNPVGLTAAITLEANGETVKNLTVDRTEQTWTYRPTAVGNLEQTIRCGDEYVSWTHKVTESTVKVEAETEALALHLSSYGRSNNEDNPGVWESGDISAEFQNFNFVSDGWKQDEEDNTVLRVTGDARLHIPYRMFASDFRTTGKTIEFEIATREVLNYDAEVINCFSDARGFVITAQQLKLASEQSQMGTRYKEDEHLRVTFVVEKRSANRLLLCYINGIMSGAAQYPTDDDFSQANPVGITIGSNDCTTDLYNIRVYDNDLTRYQVLDNWIADTQNPEDRMDRYLRNGIYDSYGRVVISQLPTDLCYMILEGSALPQFKGDKKTCNGSFVDLIHPERSFTFRNAEIDVQGTSSQYYYVKNYKIKFKNGFIRPNGSTVTAYQMNDDAVPVSTFTMKADVASSEGAFNVVLAMLYDDLCPYKTPAQETDPRIRQTIEGFPMVMFWNNGSETKFLGKYNFNNDKGTEEVFGFQSGDESWEILQNGTDRVGWHSADFSGDGWKTDFEARFPEDNTDTTRLQALAEWMVSTDTAQATGEAITPVTYGEVEYTTDTAEYRLAKFSAELADHFIEEAIIFYYLFTEMFLCIDQREKNAFPTYIASEDKWIVLFYDADSSLGTDNKGNLAFDYWLEDIDYTEAGDPIFNGQNSVLWKNLRETRHDEIMQMYKDMRTADSLSYDSTIGRFEEHQSKWPEAIFNEDMYRKCLEPLIETGDGLYIPMLQGKKEQWMKWWLYNRFRYIDSKYETGSSMENRITIRAHQKANVFLKSYANIVGHVYFNAAMVEHRMERGEEYEFEWPASGAEDPVIGINDADLMTSLGDLSPLMVELIDVSGAPHITGLKIGDGAEGYVNYSMNSITLGNNVLLRTLDMRNCVNLTQSVDASGCTNIEEAYFDGTSVTGVSLPNGGILKVLHLPGTITNLTLRNQKALTEFVIPSYSNVSTLRLENNSDVIDPLTILAGMPANSRVRIIGFSIANTTAAEVIALCDRLDTMRGLDENGNNVDKAQVSGTVYIDSLTSEELYRIQSRYPDITVVYNQLVLYTVRFWNGSTLLQTVENVAYNATAEFTGEDPIKAGETDHSRWAFNGWSPDPSAVTGDMDCYAQFKFTGSLARELVQRTIEGDYENDRVTSIRDYAFYRVNKLTSVSFPAVESAGTKAFNECSSLASAELSSLTTATSNLFMNSGKLASVTMPKVTKAEFGAFSGTIIAEIPNAENMEVVGDNAFARTKLTSIVLPEIVIIGASAFNNCAELAFADFGPSLPQIRKDVFTKCSALTTVILRSTTMVSLENANAFTGTPIASGTGYIYVPKALLEEYKAATNWSTYAAQFRAIEDYPEICGGEV